MSFKQDVVMLLLKHGAESVMKHFAYRDAEREVLRINSARFPECEFHLVPTNHKRLDELLEQGWRDALVDPQIGGGVHFPQEFLGKRVLLFKQKEQEKRIGFVQ